MAEALARGDDSDSPCSQQGSRPAAAEPLEDSDSEDAWPDTGSDCSEFEGSYS